MVAMTQFFGQIGTSKSHRRPEAQLDVYMKMVFCNLGTLLLCVLFPCSASAQPENATRLSTLEIRQVFSDVRDAAQVQGSAGTTAQNLWFKDGRLINHWSNSKASGTVTGQWYAENDMRCVLIQAGLPEAQGKKRCGPIYRSGLNYFSIHADGSIHGIHKLSPME
jgi:hypothetical protein